MSVTRVKELEPGLIDFCSATIGGEIVAFSDQYFADAVNLINPKDPIRRAGYYVSTGAWFDGWETRRHNKEATDWVIIKLGVTGVIKACEVDTAFFNGNEAPAISVEGCIDSGSIESAQWEEIVPKTPCGPSQRHFFVLSKSPDKLYTHIRLHQHPDGGIARFRLLGHVKAVFPEDRTVLDMASVKNGAVALSCSDQHFGRKENLLMPGRGVDMGDGWETARSRHPDHKDWVIIKLGAPTIATKIVVDTAHFRGNYPQSVDVFGGSTDAVDGNWTVLVPRTETQADFEHEYTIQDNTPITHVRLTIYPDGGVKRIRVYGYLSGR